MTKGSTVKITAPSFFRSKVWNRNEDKGKSILGSEENNKGKGKEGIDSPCSDSDVVLLEGSSSFVEANKRKRGYDNSQKFQDTWTAIHPWAENVVDNGEISGVKCRVCSKIEGGDTILQPKLDGLWKHAGRKRAEVAIPSQKVLKGDYYFNPKNKHVQNEKLMLSVRRDTVVQQLVRSANVERRTREVQFTFLFQLLSLGRPLTDFGASLAMFQKLKVPDCPSTHWTDSSGWDMVNCMNDLVIEKSKRVLSDAHFISFFADEVIAVDNSQWLSIHAYTMQFWKRVPLLLSLTKVVDGCGASALKEQIGSSLVYYGGLSPMDLSQKVVCFGADGVSVFQGIKSGVMKQIIDEQCPYMMSIHCMAHRTNLAMRTLSDLPLVSKVEGLCTHKHSHFGKSPKKWREFQVLAEVLETGGLKMLKNVKTRWISIKEPCQRIQDCYPTLVAKMKIDSEDRTMSSKQRGSAVKNLDLLTDIHTLLILPCLLPLLTCINDLIKYAQSRDTYVCDYISAVKIAQTELQEMYTDLNCAFKGAHFNAFTALVEGRSYIMEQDWRTDLEIDQEYLSYRVGEETYVCHYIDPVSKKKMAVSRELFQTCVLQVRSQCREAAETLVKELSNRFPKADLQNALGIIFPQFWSQPECDSMFPLHLTTIKSHFSEVRYTKGGEKEIEQVMEPLCATGLDNQAGLFKLTMRSAWEKAMGEPKDINPVTKLWQTLASSGLHWMKIPEYFKLAEIAIVTVIGSVEDERTFSNLAFIKTRVQNRLTTNLDCTVRLFSQEFWDVSTFPYQDAITAWKDKRDRRGGIT